MDLAAIATKAAALAFDIAGTAKTTAVLHLGKLGTYDPVADVTAPSAGSDVTVEGVFYKAKQTQGTDNTAKERLFIVEGADAPDGIDEADTATIDGSVWNINEVERIPTEAVIILHLRQ